MMLMLLYSITALTGVIALRGGCDPRDEKCDQPWSTPATNPTGNQYLLKLGADANTDDAPVMQIQALEIPDFRSDENGGPEFDPDAMPEFSGAPAQTVEAPTHAQIAALYSQGGGLGGGFDSAGSGAAANKATTTPPPFYTAEVKFDKIPAFTTDKMALFKLDPKLDAITTLVNGGPYLQALSRYLQPDTE